MWRIGDGVDDGRIAGPLELLRDAAEVLEIDGVTFAVLELDGVGLAVLEIDGVTAAVLDGVSVRELDREIEGVTAAVFEAVLVEVNEAEEVPEPVDERVGSEDLEDVAERERVREDDAVGSEVTEDDGV